ncbi:MAG: Anthranilate synthase, amidotransferase component @ Para-aminobenzoate synthase, amidotransferase component, partial [uncultured Solirubrobacteraceae bacterium]
ERPSRRAGRAAGPGRRRVRGAVGARRRRRGCRPGSAGADDRQLRLLHLQPRPVPGRARRRAGSRPQRPCPRRRALGGRLGRRRRLAGPVHAGRGRHQRRGDAPLPRGGDPDARRLPRPPVAGAGVRRAGDPPPAGTRQDRAGRARRRGPVRRAAEPADGRPLPLAGGRRGPARAARGDRPRRGSADGHPPSRAARARRPVPSRVGAHARRAEDARELPERMPNPIL